MFCSVSSPSTNTHTASSCCAIDALSNLAYLVKETALVIIFGLVAGAVPALAPAAAVAYVTFLATNSPEIAKIAGLVVWMSGAFLAGWLVRVSLKDFV